MLLDRLSLMAVEAASKDKVRQQLCGLHITKTETIATDGHRMIRVKHSKEWPVEDFPVIDGVSAAKVEGFKGVTLPTETVQDIIKALPKKVTLPMLKCALMDESANGTAKIAVTDLDNPRVFNPRTMDGRYPDTDQVWPKQEPKFRIALNADLLAGIFKVFKEANYGEVNGVVFEFSTPTQAVKLYPVTGDGRAEAILMPLRLPS